MWRPEHAETGPWGVRTAVLALRRLPAVRVAADDLRPFHDLWCDDCFSSLSDPRDHTGRGRGDRAEGQRMLTAPEAGGSESRVSLGPPEEEMSCGRRSDLLRPPACGGALRQPRQATGLPRRVRSAAPFPVAAPLPARGEFSAFRLLLPLRASEAGPCWSLLARRSRRGVRAAAPLSWAGRAAGGTCQPSRRCASSRPAGALVIFKSFLHVSL